MSDELRDRVRAVVPAEWGVTVTRSLNDDVRIDITQDGAAGGDLVLPASWTDDEVVDRVEQWVDDPMVLEWSELRRV